MVHAVSGKNLSIVIPGIIIQLDDILFIWQPYSLFLGIYNPKLVMEKSFFYKKILILIFGK